VNIARPPPPRVRYPRIVFGAPARGAEDGLPNGLAAGGRGRECAAPSGFHAWVWRLRDRLLREATLSAPSVAEMMLTLPSSQRTR